MPGTLWPAVANWVRVSAGCGTEYVLCGGGAGGGAGGGHGGDNRGAGIADAARCVACTRGHTQRPQRHRGAPRPPPAPQRRGSWPGLGWAGLGWAGLGWAGGRADCAGLLAAGCWLLAAGCWAGGMGSDLHILERLPPIRPSAREAEEAEEATRLHHLTSAHLATARRLTWGSSANLSEASAPP
ncbi:hypothetical protein BDZ91DRAFT_833576 [Kalaharituber pfeilii]|nr:hypothetical protein BDZ91DRAFT_833576 [Kalaharituber pfeilii]